MAKISKLFFDSPARYLLLLAAILQLTVVLGLYTMGRLAIAPNRIDEHGLLISVFTDTQTYQPQATDAADTLKQSGIKAWLLFHADAHVKFYSLSYLVFGPFLGRNIVGAEPFNLTCYLAILILIAKFSAEAFDRRAGRAAAAVVAVWPSFLLHNAQILKDPICVIALLVLMMVMTVWLTRKLSWRTGLGTGFAGGAAIGLIYATRAGFWVPVMLGLVLIGAGLLVVRQLSQRSFLPGNMLSMTLLLIVSVSSLFFAEDFFEITRAWMSPPQVVQATQPVPAPAAAPPQKNQTASAAQSPLPENRDVQNVSFPLHKPPERTNSLVIKVQQVRDSFSYRYQDSGTLIDQDVEFITPADVLRYIPRAMEIGFMAPFPNKWFGAGKKVGLAGRILSGGEMLFAYVLELFAVFGVWRARDRLSTWLLVLATMFGLTTLGLGLINVGALYRMRYGFFVLLIIVGTYGLTQVRQSFAERSQRIAALPLKV